MKKLCFLFSLLGVISNLHAHPHAFIAMLNKPLIENEQLIGFSMQWFLDQPSSAELLYDLKSMADDEISKQAMLDEAMNNIVNEHYFSYLYDADGNKIKYQRTPQNAGMKAVGMNIMYHFDLMLSQPQPLHHSRYTFSTYDSTYYVAMNYHNEVKSAVDFSQLPDQCLGQIIEPNIDDKMVDYAQSLDKSQRDVDNSLGAYFAQQVVIECK